MSEEKNERVRKFLAEEFPNGYCLVGNMCDGGGEILLQVSNMDFEEMEDEKKTEELKEMVDRIKQLME